MGYSYIHSLSKSQYINKTLVFSVLMENFQLWTDTACGVLESVGSLPWIFQSRNFLFHSCPHLPHMETSSLMPCWKAPFSCLCPFCAQFCWSSEGIRNVSAEGNWEGGNGRLFWLPGHFFKSMALHADAGWCLSSTKFLRFSKIHRQGQQKEGYWSEVQK